MAIGRSDRGRQIKREALAFKCYFQGGRIQKKNNARDTRAHLRRCYVNCQGNGEAGGSEAEKEEKDMEDKEDGKLLKD